MEEGQSPLDAAIEVLEHAKGLVERHMVRSARYPGQRANCVPPVFLRRVVTETPCMLCVSLVRYRPRYWRGRSQSFKHINDRSSERNGARSCLKCSKG